MHPSKLMAEYLIRYFAKHGDLLTNKKLQKLLYYVQVWFLVSDKAQRDLYNGLAPEAWVHGPVYPEIYKLYKPNGYNHIDITKLKPDVENSSRLNELLVDLKIEGDEKLLLDNILAHYGPKSAFELEMLTHRALPWIEARKGFDSIEPCSNPIDLDLVKDYYTKLNKKQVA